MSDSWDGQKKPVVLSRQMDNDSRPKTAEEEDAQYTLTGNQARKGFSEFFKNFRIGGVFHYREALLRNWNKKHYFVEVNLAHVYEYNDMLLNALQVCCCYDDLTPCSADCNRPQLL
jgi:hypothetical protein